MDDEQVATGSEPERRSWARISPAGFDEERAVVRMTAVMLDDGRWSAGASFASPIAGEPAFLRAERIAIMRQGIAELTRMVESAEAWPPHPNDP